MATIGARTSGAVDPGTDRVFDGFISYSHAADDLLAPRLQAGLQPFAKPWWKRRALRIFRLLSLYTNGASRGGSGHGSLAGRRAVSHQPFHIREGFVNNREEPLGAAFPPDYDFQVFITRRQGPPLHGGAFAIDTPYRYTADFLVRESSDRCGPAFLDQTEPLPCDEFVHDFPEGLPPGRYHLWVEWQAPCSAWTTVDVCDEDDTPLTLFAARADIAFYHDDYTPDDDGLSGFGALWPIDDPWEIETEPAG